MQPISRRNASAALSALMLLCTRRFSAALIVQGYFGSVTNSQANCTGSTARVCALTSAISLQLALATSSRPARCPTTSVPCAPIPWPLETTAPVNSECCFIGVRSPPCAMTVGPNWKCSCVGGAYALSSFSSGQVTCAHCPAGCVLHFRCQMLTVCHLAAFSARSAQTARSPSAHATTTALRSRPRLRCATTAPRQQAPFPSPPVSATPASVPL